MKGYFSEETLNNYARLAAEKLDVDFAEGNFYDFTTCIRPDGSAYGTSGKCRKGTEGEAQRDPSKDVKRGDTLIGTSPRNMQIDKLNELKKEYEDYKKKFGGRADLKNVMEAYEKRIASGEQALKAGAPAKAESPKATNSAQIAKTVKELSDKWQDTRVAVRNAENEYKQVMKMTKNDNSPAARKQRLEAGRAVDKAQQVRDRAQRAWDKMSSKFHSARKREELKAMSPEQRKEARRVEKIIKERG
jgi:hypothetical protein